MHRSAHMMMRKQHATKLASLWRKSPSQLQTKLTICFRNYPSYRPLMTPSFRPSASTSSHSTGSANRMIRNRSIHFLPFLGLWGFKHISTWTLYNACKSYGWPRVYRRLLEQNRLLHHQNQNSKLIIQRLIRQAIEAPPQFAAQLSESYNQHIVPLLQRISQQTATRTTAETQGATKVPQFLIVTAKYILNSQKPIKIIQDFVNAASKRN